MGETKSPTLAARLAKIGKEIGEMLNPQDSEWYDNFTWFGEGGFFPGITEDFRTMTNIVLNKIFKETNSYYGKKTKR